MNNKNKNFDITKEQLNKLTISEIFNRLPLEKAAQTLQAIADIAILDEFNLLCAAMEFCTFSQFAKLFESVRGKKVWKEPHSIIIYGGWDGYQPYFSIDGYPTGK